MTKSQRTNRGGGTKALELPKGYKVASFTRVRENDFLTKAPIDTGLPWEFQFQDIPDYNDFTSLYDGYILDEVEIHFHLRALGTSGNKQDFPTLYVAPDYDGEGIPGTVAVVTTKEQVKLHPFSTSRNTFKFSVKPRAALTVYKGGVTSAYGWAPSNQIIDMNNVDVKHYGAVHWLSFYNSVATPDTYVATTLVYRFRCVGQR